MTQPSAGGVAARTDEPVHQFTVATNVSASHDMQLAAADIAETVVEHSLSTERRVRPIPSRFRSDCPGWLGAVLNYGAMAQAFITDWMVKHKHMSFDFDTVHTDNYSSIVYSEPVEYEIRTAPDTVPKLWCHQWKEPPPPCVGMVSDNFVNWARDARGPVARRRWEGDRGIWFGWDCFGLWKVWPTIAALNHPKCDRVLLGKSWANHNRSMHIYDEPKGTHWARKPSSVLNEMSGEKAVDDPYWGLSYKLLRPSNAYLPRLPAVTDGRTDSEITASRERLAATTNTIVDSSWADPDIVAVFHTVPIASHVINWNKRLMSRGRWDKRFIVRDIEPLYNTGKLPHTWATGFEGKDWLEQIRQLNLAYNYLMNGRWIVWATLMYALAYYRGDSQKLPDWWINFCSAWAVPVPRFDREARSISADGGLSIVPDDVPKHFHGDYKLEKLFRTCEKACPIPGSEPVSAMQQNRILSWPGTATGQYRPAVRWPNDWWSYQLSREDVGTNWADIVQGAVLSIAASAASSSLNAVLDVALDSAGALLEQLPDVIEKGVEGFLSHISSQLCAFAGNLVKGYVQEFDLQSTIMPCLEAISRYGTDGFQEVAYSLFGDTSIAGDTVAIYNQLRGQLETQLRIADDDWGYIEDLFGKEQTIDSLVFGDDETDKLRKAAGRFAPGLLY